MISLIRYTINEYWREKKLLFRLAYIHMSQNTVKATGGVFWTYIHDVLYFVAFTVFRILLAGEGKVDGMSSVEYLMTGLVPWLLISEVLNNATNAIRNNKVIVQSIKFPIIILPGVEVLAILMKRLPTFIFTFIVIIYYGHIQYFHFFLFLYYLSAMVVFLCSITFFISAINAVCEDFHQLYIAFMKVIFFSIPIMWNADTIRGTQYSFLETILKLNPLVYIINGFRDAFIHGNTQTIFYGGYFWFVTWIIMVLGCFAQKRLQKYFSDFI